jgi:hypothetical protein
MSSPRNNRPLFAALLLGGLLYNLLSGIQAFDRLTLSIEKIEGTGWRAQGLNFDLDWQTEEQTRYRLEFAQIELPELQQTLQGVSIDCESGEVSARRISCSQGRVHLPMPQLDKPQLEVSFDYEQQSGRLSGGFKGIALAGGRLDIAFVLEQERWQADLSGRSLALQALVGLLPEEQRPLQGWSYQGRVSPRIRLIGQSPELLEAAWKADLSQFGYADESYTIMGENLGGSLTGSLEARQKGWRLKGELALNQGEMLTPYFYANPANHPLSLHATLTTDLELQKLALDPSRLNLQGLLALSFQGELDLTAEQPLRRLALEMEPAQAAALYRELLQPVLLGTPWERLEVEGEVSLAANSADTEASLDLHLSEFNFDDAESDDNPRRLGLYGLNGELHWRQGGQAPGSRLEWQNGHLLERIDLGAGRLDFNLTERDFRLTREAKIPILDGELLIDRLQIDAIATPDQNLQFDGILTPISLSTLSEALGWLPLKGKLSGVIPGLSYKNGQFALDGVLLMSIFDGDILIEKLKVRDLLGVYPLLSADVEIKGLDLETLTSAFSFGRITGRLDGYMRELSLEQWRPVAFDAHFHTPEGDKSRRRISQKAVDNISNLGGAGMSGALARSFLGFFEEFGYKRLGLGCRLQSGECEMKGVGEAKQGYYLVEGSGIPRIDIIGYNKTADWERLVEQLKQITESSGPVVQ